MGGAWVSARALVTHPLPVYITCVLLPLVLAGISCLYTINIDTGIQSFRAREEPTAIHQDALTAAKEHARAHHPHIAVPPSPPQSTQHSNTRQQSIGSFWLTMVYETIPSGGDILQPEHWEKIRALEQRVASAAGYENFCFHADKDECSPPLSLISIQGVVSDELRANPDGQLASLVRAWTPAGNASAPPGVAGLGDAEFLQLARSLPAAIGSPLIPPALGKGTNLFSTGHGVDWFFDQAFLTEQSRTCTALR
eukprot:CAMPEP_0118956160 /NCGR_PEP_ID=MMETSP1169-20130426/61232_1 /TAXON_ID=36882 /ORGANISM="Pyramimonas obovata, Strain CCMP722" /LENGTH=252 /DNA_ID=CAMNT_0006904139 /DNA_START=97 /DNA_END=851 /DNA_ORIENTATION=-